ncbi:MAG: glycosyltransferase [Cryomorphaceae bacterium]|nr:glycosyltransferase [Cryomorphaceae bacterium]
MCKVSVIIPYYNSSPYLEDCLKAVCGQTLAEIEILCINDGSTDGSGDLVAGFNDPRIRRIDLPNGGQGIARNVGIDEAKGDYLTFVDSDDLPEPNQLKTLYNACLDNVADFAWGLSRCFSGTINLHEPSKYYDEEGKRISQTKCRFGKSDNQHVFEAAQMYKLVNAATAVPWNKLLRRSFVLQKQIRFSEHLIHEDLLFYFLTLMHAKRSVFVNDILYNHRRWPGSTMHTISAKNHHKILEVMDVVKAQIDNSENTHLEKAFSIFQAKQLLSSLNGVLVNPKIATADRERFFQEVRNRLKNLKESKTLTIKERTQLQSLKMNGFYASILINKLPIGF